MTKENIHPVIQSRICCQDSRWMSEYWWSWKLRRVPFFYITPVEDGIGGKGGLLPGFHGERHLFLNIQNPGVLRRVSKGDQSHFEALGASFVCEGCEVLPKWLRRFFTCSWHSVPLHSLFFGGLKFADTWLNPDHFGKDCLDKDLSSWKSYLLLDRRVEGKQQKMPLLWALWVLFGV